MTVNAETMRTVPVNQTITVELDPRGVPDSTVEVKVTGIASFFSRNDLLTFSAVSCLDALSNVYYHLLTCPVIPECCMTPEFSTDTSIIRKQ